MANIKRIIYKDISNGPGFRTTVFLSGCPGVVWNKRLKKYEHCNGCFNNEAWNFQTGRKITDEIIFNEIIKPSSIEYVSGLSILGGEPLCKENQETVAKIIEIFRKEFRNTKNIWVWTGYIYTKNPFNKNKIPYTKWKKYILNNINTLVDGPFIKDKFNIDLIYRGSSNQRVLNFLK